MARRLVIHNHFARDAGRAVSREDEERNREASYAATGISRDSELYRFVLHVQQYNQFNRRPDNVYTVTLVAANEAEARAKSGIDPGDKIIRAEKQGRARDAGEQRYQIKREKRQYDTKFTLVDTKTGEVVRGPTYSVDVPQYMLQIKDQLNGPQKGPTQHDALPVNSTGKSASEWSRIMSDLRAKKPRPINKLWNNPSSAPPAEVAAAEQRIRDWNREYSQASKMQKKALEEDNENFRKAQGST